MKMTDQVAGQDNDGVSKSQGVKMQDMKMQDTKMQGTKMQDMKIENMQQLFTCSASTGC